MISILEQEVEGEERRVFLDDDWIYGFRFY